MKAHFRFLCLCLAMLCVGTASRAQLSGTYTVPSTTYPTLASIITALNTQGVGAGGVVINFTASTNETAPAGGYQLGSTTLNASTSSTNTITINGNSNLITANVGTGSADGIFWIRGTDFVTINNLNLTDPAANTSTTTQMEWGYVLCKLNTSSPYDGAQNNKINACTITLRNTGSTTYGIYQAHIGYGSTSTLSTTSAVTADGNHYNKFTGNTISGVARGIYTIGIATLAQYDKGTEIGGTTTGSGNTITVGFSGVANTSYGIRTDNDSVMTIRNNTINIATGHGNAGVYGIYCGTGKGTLTVANNYIDMTAATTSATMYGWYGSGHTDAGASINCLNNTVTGNNTVNTSGYLYGFYFTGASALYTQSGNSVRNMNWTATTAGGYFYGFYNSTSTSPFMDITNNTVYNIDRTASLTSTTSTYYTYCFYNTSSNSNPAGRLNVSNNTIRKIRNNYYLYSFYNQGYTSNGGQPLIAKNNMTDSIDLSTSTAPYLYHYIGNYGSDSSIIAYNTLKNVQMSNNTTAGSIYNYIGYGYYGQYKYQVVGNVTDSITGNAYYLYNYAMYASRTDSNRFTNIKWGVTTGTPSNTGAMYNYLGYYNQYAYSCSDNYFNNITGPGQSVYSYMGYGGGFASTKRNRWDNITLGNSGSFQNYVGSYCSGSITEGNVINNLTLGTGLCYGFYVYQNGIADTLKNNRISNLTVTTGTANTLYCFYLQGTTGDPMTLYNNSIANINLPATWSSSTSFIGMYLASPIDYRLYHNTIYVNPGGSPTGASYGGTGIYYLSTINSLDLKNNIINMNMVPGSSGFVVALRRNNGTAGIAPSNFAGTSDGNIYWVPNASNAHYYAEGTAAASFVNVFNATNDPNFNTPCGAFKSFVGHDKGSFAENNMVAGATPGTYAPSGTSFAESGGVATNQPAVLVDHNYTTRGGLPDIGAIEFSGTALDQAPPAISYTPVAKSSYCVSAPTLAVTITDVTGVNNTTNPPRLYYKKSTENNTIGATNTSASNGWKYVTPASVTGNVYTFNMDYSLLTSTVSAGDSITYFVIAQDITTATNTNAATAAFTVCPTTVALTSSNTPILAAPAPNGFKILTTPTFAINAFPVGLCGSGSVTMALNINPVGTNVQWQQAPLSTGVFTNITGATGTTYTTPVLTAHTIYRVQIFCGSSVLTTTANDTIYVANPAITSTTPATRCGYGPVTLVANVAAPATVNWYTTPSGGQPIYTGQTFNTASLPGMSGNLTGTRTFYASGVVPHAATESIGKPSGLNYGYYTYSGYGVNITLTNPSTHLYNTTIYPQGSGTITIDLIDASTATSVASTGPIAVSGAGAATPVVVPLNFYNVPAGQYNLIISGYTGSPQLLYEYQYPTWAYPYASASGASSVTGSNMFGGTYAYYYAYFYNIKVSGNCQSARTAVTATVTPATPITATSPNTPGICTGSSATLNVSSSNFAYLYAWQWAPTGTATGNSISVTPTSSNKYYVIATDYSTGCSAVDSISLAVTNQPAAPTVAPTNPTICQGGQVQLTATSSAAATGSGIVGTGTLSTGTSGYPLPYNNYWTSQHDQYLVTAAELTAAGVTPGNLTSIAFYQDLPYVVTSGGYTTMDAFTIKLANTSNTNLSGGFVTSGFTTVHTTPSLTLSTTTTGSWVTHTFSTPYAWNGTSNIVVDVTHHNCSSPTNCCTNYNFGGGGSVRYSNTSFVSSAYAYNDGDCSIITMSPASGVTTASRRPNMMFTYGSGYGIGWNNVTGLYKNTTLTTPLVITDTAARVYASPATTQVYRAFVNANGCLSPLSAPDTVFVTPAPNVTISPAGPQAICSLNSVTLSIPSASGQTYQWYLNNVAIPGANANTYTATAAGSYTVTAINTTTSCQATSTATVVTVNALPTSVIAAAGPTTFCNGGSVVLNATTVPGAAYQWKLNGAPIGSAISPSYTATTSGNYTVDVTNGNQCTLTSNVITVTVNTTPTTVTPAGSTNVCTGGSVVLNAPTTGGTYTYQWNLNGTSLGSTATGASYTATASGSYTVTVTNTGTTCVATSTPIVVNVGTPPSSAITPAGSAGVCTGSTTTLSAVAAPGLTYQWNNASGPISGATGATFTTGVAGSYTVTVSLGASCTSTSSTPTVVTVNPLPTATATAGGPTTFCSGVGVTLSANTGSGVTGYQWNLNGTPISGATAATYSANATGTYTVTTTNGSTTCSNTSSGIAVTANSIPAPVATPATNPTFCAGGSVVISTPAVTGNTYSWTRNGTPIATGTSITANTTGNYIVTATNAAGCTGSSQVVSVLVNALPNVTTTPASAATVCQGNTTTLSVPAGPTGATNYLWKLNGNPITGATGSTFVTGAGGTYTVDVTNTVTGCVATSTGIVVTVVAPPTATATAVGPTTFCNGDSSRINANLGTGLTYQWRLNGNNIVGETADKIFAKVSGTYSVRVTNAAGCSANSSNILITVNPTPPAYITYSTPLSFCEGSAVVLNANAGAGLTYQWMYNGAPVANTSTIYIASTTGVYSLKTTNTFGCSTMSDTLNVLVHPKPVPVITRTRDTLSTSASYLSYQWFFNNQAIAGATTDFITFNTNGAYRVRVTDANGCEGLSEILFMNNVGVASTPVSRSIRIYPNPTNGIMHIDASVKIKVSLRDVTGKAVLEGSDVKEIDLGDVANGTYLLYVSTMDGQLLKVEKVTKTNN